MINDNKRSPMAYFRYNLINSLLAPDTTRTLKQRMQLLADQIWTLPDGSTQQFAWGTIETWYYAFKNGGIEALTDTPRKDFGTHPGLPETIAGAIDELLTEQPSLLTSQIITILKRKKLIVDNKPSNSTIYRYVKTQQDIVKPPPRERRSFEAPHAGCLWQADIMYGPYVSVKGSDGRYRKHQTYLIAIIDDHSRLLCHGQFYLNQSLQSWIDCLKKACQKRGIPKCLYCDNGKVFLSPQVKRIGAELGIGIIHTKPRDCQAKGKIERFFRSVRDRFIAIASTQNPFKYLDDLNARFGHWMEVEYNDSFHSAIQTTPMQKWIATSHKVKMLPFDDNRDQAFFIQENRKVKKDGTFQLKGRRFETDWTLAGQTIRVKYNPQDPTTIYVYFQQHFYGRANPLETNVNFRISRKKKNENS